MLTAAQQGDPFEGLTDGEVLSRVDSRVVSADVLPSWDGYSYRRELAPGLFSVLAFDYPETVTLLADRHLSRFGDLDDLWRSGLANLGALPMEQVQPMHVKDGSHFDVLGMSVYTASKVLVMAELVRGLCGVTDIPYGVLVRMANRHQVAVHVIWDGTVIPTLNRMAVFAGFGFTDRPGPLSLHVYWWRDGGLGLVCLRSDPRWIRAGGRGGAAVRADRFTRFWPAGIAVRCPPSTSRSDRRLARNVGADG